MANVVNLKRLRKADNKMKKAIKASENAAKYGRTKSQKAAESSDQLRAARHLDNHRFDKDV